MEELDRDIVVFTDEDGSEIELEVMDYFDYEGQEYAVLFDPAATEEGEQDLFVFKVVISGEYEEFLPADEDKMDILANIVEQRLECDKASCEGCPGGCGAE